MFALPSLHENPEGWGPATSFVPPQFEEFPFAPFDKSDKLGKVCDFTSQGIRGKDGRFRDQTQEEEDQFRLVDNRPVQKTRFRFDRRRFQRTNERRNDGAGVWGNQRPQQQKQGGKYQKQQQQQTGRRQQGYGGGGRSYDNRPRVYREASVELKPDWAVVEEMSLSNLNKLTYDVEVKTTDIISCGSLDVYDKKYDRVTAKMEVPLLRADSVTFFNVTTSDDPVIQQLAAQDAGNVFATDSILATLMAAPRSVYSWDIVVHRVGSKLFFDKRDGSSFDYLTVNETAQEPPSNEDRESLNAPVRLSQEATFINQNFSQQVLSRSGEGKCTFDHLNPFEEAAANIASVAYKYRKFQLAEDVTVVVRCELDAVVKGKDNENTFITVKALNEYDPRLSNMDWRQKIDSQRGAVLATELKNNSCKLAKWTAEAMLAGAEQMKIGYVSRAHPRDPYNHVILGTNFYKTKDFANQINLNLSNSWGIVRALIDQCMQLPEGKYIYVKDPMKPIVRLYEVPMDAFEEAEEEESKPQSQEADS